MPLLGTIKMRIKENEPLAHSRSCRRRSQVAVAMRISAVCQLLSDEYNLASLVAHKKSLPNLDHPTVVEDR